MKHIFIRESRNEIPQPRGKKRIFIKFCRRAFVLIRDLFRPFAFYVVRNRYQPSAISSTQMYSSVLTAGGVFAGE